MITIKAIKLLMRQRNCGSYFYMVYKNISCYRIFCSADKLILTFYGVRASAHFISIFEVILPSKGATIYWQQLFKTFLSLHLCWSFTFVWLSRCPGSVR